MKKKLSDIFDQATPKELDQLSDALTAPDLPPEVLSSIKDKVYFKTGVSKRRRVSKGLWLRGGLIAACLTLMATALVLVPMMRKKAPAVLPPVIDTEEGSGESLPGTDAEQSSGEVWEPDTGMQPDFAFSAYISDPDFENYDLYDIFTCPPEQVGDYFDDITVTASFGPDQEIAMTAKVYRVVGIDGDLCLCMRYEDEGAYGFHRNFIDFEAYYFLQAKSYAFPSYEDMLKVIYKDGVRLPNFFGYSQNPREKYYLNQNLVDEMQALLLSQKGSWADPKTGVTLETVQTEADAFLASSMGFEGSLGIISGLLRIYDNGYLYFGAFGGQLFDIGRENAQNIISFILNNAVTGYYEWIESQGKLYPVIYDEEAAYPIFSTALEENKLYSQLYFKETVTYWENVYGASHQELSLSRDTLTAMADILNSADGRAVKNNEIPGFSIEEQLFHPKEAVVLTHSWGLEDESGCDISVFDCGHVGLNGDYYFVGMDVTDRILALLHGDGDIS